VIAIIGILAAMVFPVFARARESARKAVCLSNVKNIALAIQMYLSDNNDTLAPTEHRAEVLDWFLPMAYGVDPDCYWAGGSQNMLPRINPYLAWPVLLDEYIKNRDVWRCPSAKMVYGAWTVLSDPDWFREVWNYAGGGPLYDYYMTKPCSGQFYPNGWGGDVTDSIIQERRAVPTGAAPEGQATGAFVQSIAITSPNREVKLVSVERVAEFVIVHDSGAEMPMGSFTEQMAFPDLCNLARGCSDDPCADSVDCNAYPEYRTDPSLRRKGARHLGGNNYGFLDGHAAWIPAELFLTKSPRWSNGCWEGTVVDRELLGYGPMGPTTAGGGGGVAEGSLNPDVTCGFLY
jgi:prepilin-type processing-associated H-X9-DG protein